MHVRGPNNVGRTSAVQTDPTLLLYASTISERKKCWGLLAQTFDRFQTILILRFLFNTLCLTNNCNSSSASCQENPAYYLTKPKYHTEEH